MKSKLTQYVLTAVSIFALAMPAALAQEDTVKGKPTVSGQMKEGTKEVGKAGKSLGKNVKRGRVVRGGKQFGKHSAHGGKHYARGSVTGAKKTAHVSKRLAKKSAHATKKATKKTVKAIKKTVD